MAQLTTYSPDGDDPWKDQKVTRPNATCRRHSGIFARKRKDCAGCKRKAYLWEKAMASNVRAIYRYTTEGPLKIHLFKGEHAVCSPNVTRTWMQGWPGHLPKAHRKHLCKACEGSAQHKRREREPEKKIPHDHTGDSCDRYGCTFGDEDDEKEPEVF